MKINKLKLMKDLDLNGIKIKRVMKKRRMKIKQRKKMID